MGEVGKHLTQQQIEDMRVFEELGLSRKEISKEIGCTIETIRKHLGASKQRSHVNEEAVQKMEKLRQQGLSNSQIARELNINYTTVLKHVGKEKDMSRAKYGSIVAHATGDSYLPPAQEEEPKVNKPLKMVRTSVSFDGKEFSYKVTTDGQVRITSPTGVTHNMNKEELFAFIAELCELGDWLTKNSTP